MWANIDFLLMKSVPNKCFKNKTVAEQEERLNGTAYVYMYIGATCPLHIDSSLDIDTRPRFLPPRLGRPKTGIHHTPDGTAYTSRYVCSLQSKRS